MGNRFKIEAFLDQAAGARAAVADANHFLYLVRANQLAAVDAGRIKLPTLVIYAPGDLVFYEPWVEEAIQKLAAAGTPVERRALLGPYGHLNGVLAIGQAAAQISAFLSH
jgi:homoserine O-acetyltransferase